MWDLIHRLHERWSWHRVKPFLTFEARYFQATSLGLPLEISKYYQSISAITVNGEQPDRTILEFMLKKKQAEEFVVTQTAELNSNISVVYL